MSDTSDPIDAATSAELASASFDATDASFASWGDSIQADSNATAAFYAGDEAGVEYWDGVSDAAEADSQAFDAAAGDLWSEAATADAEPVYEPTYEATYDDGGYVEPTYDATYDAGVVDTGYDDPTYDAGVVDTGYVDPGYVDTSGGFDAGAGYDAGAADTGYDPSASWAATDTVTDYYTDADW